MRIPSLTHIQTSDVLHIHLKYEDGTEGFIDFGSKKLLGILSKLKNSEFFNAAKLNKGVIIWQDEIEINGDSLYLELTGMYFQKWKEKQQKNS